MSQINTLTGLASSATLREFVNEATKRRETSAGAPAPHDRVELSELGRFLDKLAGLPDVRVEKVAQVRAAISRGDYETPGKLDHAIEKLLVDI